MDIMLGLSPAMVGIITYRRSAPPKRHTASHFFYVKGEKPHMANMKKRREADKLDTDTSEHGREVKRMRAYSIDEPVPPKDNDNDLKKPRTRSDISVEEWRQQQQITVSDQSAPDPYREFSQTPFGSVIQQALTREGFAKPTAIQAQAWSIGIAGKDMISIAKTGSGACVFASSDSAESHTANNPSV
jgi:hypothetical protein